MLNLLFRFALRHDAIARPVEGTSPLRTPKGAPQAAVWRTGPGLPGPKPDGQVRDITELLLGTAMRLGEVLARLKPVFDELVGSERPQTGIWWLIKKNGNGIGPRLLAQMACGEIEISHDTFRALPSDRAHDYLRSLLAAVGILPAFDIHLVGVGLAAELVDLLGRIRTQAGWNLDTHMIRARLPIRPSTRPFISAAAL